MTTGVRTAREPLAPWDAGTAQAPVGSDYGDVTHEGDERPRTAPVVYPKRSELRRAEARARRDGGRRGERRPASSTARPAVTGPHGGQGHAGQHVAAPRSRVTQSRLSPPHPGPSPAWRLPGQSADTSPSGLRLPTASQPSSFPPPPSLFAPASSFAPPAASSQAARLDDTSPITRVVGTHAAGGPVTAMPDPARWAQDEPASPRRSRRRPDVPEAAPAGRSRRPAPAATIITPGRGTSSAARLLALALVVGFEGLAVTSLARTARTAPLPDDAETVPAGAVSSAAVLAGGGERLAVVDQAQNLGSVAEQAHAGGAKLATVMREAKAKADREKVLAERRARAMRNAQRDPKSVARLLVAERGWAPSQFSCLDKLWTKESRWNYRAQNPSSGAYGIPQALPGSKMGTVASDWRTNPVTQIKWGLRYIDGRYGTPCGAWQHSRSVGWY